MLIRHERLRGARALMYGCLVFAGVCAMFFRSDLVDRQVGPVVNFIWAVCMAISSSICLYGALSDKWIGEYSGLPLLFSVLGLYGLSALFGADWNPSPLFGYGLIVVGFSSGLIARWQDVLDAKKRAEGDRGRIGE